MQPMNIRQYTMTRQLTYHFYPGVIVLVAYVLLSNWLLDLKWPSFLGLFIVEVLILAPITLTHLSWKAGGFFRISQVIPYWQKLSPGKFILWVIGGFVACLIIYVPMYPLGLMLRESVFAWLPPWFFDPMFGTNDMEAIGRIFLLGIITDGIIAPMAEELYFRGYLLPRMTFLKRWAPWVNGALFGLYHFWQPHNYLAIIGVGIVLSYVVWKTRNVWIGIFVHCLLNTIGAIMGYLAITGGEMIGR